MKDSKLSGNIIDLSLEQDLKLEQINGLGSEMIVHTNITLNDGKTYAALIRPMVQKMLLLYEIKKNAIIPLSDSFTMFAFMLSPSSEVEDLNNKIERLRTSYESSILSKLEEFMTDEDRFFEKLGDEIDKLADKDKN